MSDLTLSPQQVVDFLTNNPEFLNDHAEVFAGLHVPNPDGPGTLSLLERQVTMLRERLNNAHSNLNELGYIAHENQGINDTITDWCAGLLAQKEEELIPAAIVTGLQDVFPDLEVELLLWGLENLEDYQLEDNKEVQEYIQTLAAPYTGKKVHPGIAAWLSEPAASIAIAPIYVNDAAIGALVFASQDAEHFYEGMGIVFLETLSYLASAAVSRLAPSIMEDEGAKDTEDDSDNDNDIKEDDYPELEPA